MGLLKPAIRMTAVFAVFLLLFSNAIVWHFEGFGANGGVKGFLTAPVKVIEYRLHHSGPPRIENHVGKEVPPWRPFSPGKLLRDINSPPVREYIDKLINESILRIRASGYPIDPSLVRGTAYSLLLERVVYTYHPGWNLPSETISNGGVCRDWALVDYALIRAVNMRFNISADYYLVIAYPRVGEGHAFLAVYYPKTKTWELYDWFATPYLESPYENSKFKVVKLGKNTYLAGWFPAGVARTNSFSSIEEALSVYSLAGGFIQSGYNVTLYRLPGFEEEFSFPSFSVLKSAEKKLSEIKIRFGNYGKTYTIRITPIGNLSVRLSNVTLYGNFLRLNLSFAKLNPPVELVASLGGEIIFPRADLKIIKWRGLSYVEGYPAYKYLLLRNSLKSVTLLVERNREYLPLISAFEVTVQEYLGGRGFMIEISSW